MSIASSRTVRCSTSRSRRSFAALGSGLSFVGRVLVFGPAFALYGHPFPCDTSRSMTVGVLERPSAVTRRPDRLFYTGMATAFALVVLVGFARTYYLRPRFVADGLPLYLHLHGAVFTAWIALLVVQTTLVAAHRTPLHRIVGWVGAGLAALVVIVGVTTAIVFGRGTIEAGFGDEVRAFLTTPFFSMTCFVILVAAAIVSRTRPQTHKRLMLLATINLLDAPIARWPGAPGSTAVYMLVDLFIVAGILYDLATRRRVDPAYLWGGALVVAGQVLRDPVGQTATWNAIARAIIG